MLMAAEGELTPVEQKVVIVHSLNRWNGLICLDDGDKECEYPINWRQMIEGSYKFVYKSKKNLKIVKFTLTPTESKIIVVFSESAS